MCWPGWIMPAAYTRFAAGSTTGVPVMPTGSTLPQGNDDPATGSPRCALHAMVPSVAFSEYTVSFSVATITRSPTISGCA